MLRLACESSDNALRSAALNALVAYDDPSIAPAVIAAAASMPDDVLAAAQSLLVARRAWAHEFLKAIDSGTFDAHTVPREIVEKLTLLGDQQIKVAVKRLWGPVKPVSTAEHPRESLA